MAQVNGHPQGTVTLPLGQEPNHADQGSIRSLNTEAPTFCMCVHVCASVCMCVHVSASHIGQTLNMSHHNSDTNHSASNSTYRPSRVTTKLGSMPC